METFTFKEDGTEDKEVTLQKVMDEFDERFLPKENETFERYQFFTCRQEGETADTFITIYPSGCRQ